MGPDFLFVGAGSVALVWAMVVAVSAYRWHPRIRWRAAFLWALLGMGLLVQGFAPHLEVEHSQFVVHLSRLPADQEIQPDAIVARERRMQILSGILTAGAAVGLALHYWPARGRGNASADRQVPASGAAVCTTSPAMRRDRPSEERRT